MNFKRILVAINHFPLTSTVFDRALHLAQQEQAHLMILHCIADVTKFSQGIESENMYGFYPVNTEFSQPFYTETIQSENHEAESWLQEYCQKATALNVPVEPQNHFGAKGATICSAAQQWDTDLIILGRHDHAAMGYAPLEAIAEFFTGSVSNYGKPQLELEALQVTTPHQELKP